MKVELKTYNNNWFKPGRNKLIELIWYCCNAVFLNSYIIPISSFKVFILKLFGAKIGKGVNIKPKVNIKYPWKLTIGDYSWIGENYGQIIIEAMINSCIPLLSDKTP